MKHAKAKYTAALKRAKAHYRPDGGPIRLGIGDLSKVGAHWVGQFHESESRVHAALGGYATDPRVESLTIAPMGNGQIRVDFMLTSVMHRKEFMELLGRLAQSREYDIRKWTPLDHPDSL